MLQRKRIEITLRPFIRISTLNNPIGQLKVLSKNVPVVGREVGGDVDAKVEKD